MDDQDAVTDPPARADLSADGAGERSVEAAPAPVYLDDIGHLWSADRERLHVFAAGIGMYRSWFQERPRLYHYDVMSQTKRAQARRNGAITVTAREMVRLINAAQGPQAD